MNMYEIEAVFTWGSKVFSFRSLAEVETFRGIVLLCEECILTRPPRKVVKERI